MIIREYKEGDREQIEDCIAKLQEFEDPFEPGRRPGKDMSAQYLNYLLEECAKKQGKIFVAEDGEKIVGFICVYIDEELQDIMYFQPVDRFAYVADYFVKEEDRGKGVGRKLMERAEQFAKEHDLKKVRLHVLAKNDLGRKVYKELGFEDNLITAVKSL